MQKRPAKASPSHSQWQPNTDSPSAEMLTARAQAAGKRGDLAELGRVEHDVFALLRTAKPGDESVVVAVQTLLQALTVCRAYDRALAFAQESTLLLGYDRLASPELTLRLAMGDITGGRRLADELASAPVTFGGHASRATVRSLLGRLEDASDDGRQFIAEAREAALSIPSWREAARRYAPSTAHTLSRYGYLHGELAQRFPGSRLWDGEPLKGRTVVLQLVEGLGDQIQGLRFAQSIRDRGGRVLVGCDEPLHELVSACELADGFIQRPIPEHHDYGPVDFYLVVGGWLHESGLPPAQWPPAPYLQLAHRPPPPGQTRQASTLESSGPEIRPFHLKQPAACLTRR